MWPLSLSTSQCEFCCCLSMTYIGSNETIIIKKALQSCVWPLEGSGWMLTLYPWLMPLMNCGLGALHVKRTVVELTASAWTFPGGTVGTWKEKIWGDEMVREIKEWTVTEKRDTGNNSILFVLWELLDMVYKLLSHIKINLAWKAAILNWWFWPVIPYRSVSNHHNHTTVSSFWHNYYTNMISWPKTYIFSCEPPCCVQPCNCMIFHHYKQFNIL